MSGRGFNVRATATFISSGSYGRKSVTLGSEILCSACRGEIQRAAESGLRFARFTTGPRLTDSCSRCGATPTSD